MADRMQIGTGVKFALGENPKSVYNDRDETPITRMATAAMIREGLAKAQRYQQELDFAESDPDDRRYLELAVDFYARLNDLTDAQLEAAGFGRDELEEGLRDMAGRFGVSLL